MTSEEWEEYKKRQKISLLRARRGTMLWHGSQGTAMATGARLTGVARLRGHKNTHQYVKYVPK